jgi:beta-lactamase class A
MKLLAFLAGMCASVLLIFFGLTVFQQNHGAALPRADRSYHIDEATLTAVMNDAVAGNPKLDLSIAITDLQTGKRYQYGDDLQYGAASIGKLVTATAYLRQIEVGNVRLEDPVGDASGSAQLERMIVKSDNTAWHEINQLVTADGLRNYARSIGINSYEPADNLIRSSDVALLLEKLASYKLLTTADTDLLLSLLERANMANYIVAAAAGKAQTYHKVGYLADRLHDAAILKHGDRAYVLVIFSKSQGSYDFTKGATVFQSITSSTLRVFFGL